MSYHRLMPYCCWLLLSACLLFCLYQECCASLKLINLPKAARQMESTKGSPQLIKWKHHHCLDEISETIEIGVLVLMMMMFEGARPTTQMTIFSLSLSPYQLPQNKWISIGKRQYSRSRILSVMRCKENYQRMHFLKKKESKGEPTVPAKNW